jgi:murein L,D-transpeptidase YafK
MQFFISIFLSLMLQQGSFKQSQLKNARVKVAYDEKLDVIKKYFEAKNLQFEGFHLFLRAFKKEMKLEAWIQEKGKSEFALLHTYDFCSTSGTLGPKRKEGDLQIPEGIYHINHFNPQSNFYLSLGISYPNASDKILSDPKSPGGAIYIHGNCVTVGCIPITDDKIKELYLLAVEAKNNGQQQVPIHIFPARLDDEPIQQLQKEYSQHQAFWKNLQLMYNSFERTRKVSTHRVNDKGEYVIL